MSKLWLMVVPLVVALIWGASTNFFGLTDTAPSPHIEGPTRVVVTKLAGLPGVTHGEFALRGFADGGYKSMYWTDVNGTDAPFQGNGVDEEFVCPDVGSFQVTLTEVNREGKRGVATTTVNCVAAE